MPSALYLHLAAASPFAGCELLQGQAFQLPFWPPQDAAGNTTGTFATLLGGAGPDVEWCLYATGELQDALYVTEGHGTAWLGAGTKQVWLQKQADGSYLRCRGRCSSYRCPQCAPCPSRPQRPKPRDPATREQAKLKEAFLQSPSQAIESVMIAMVETLKTIRKEDRQSCERMKSDMLPRLQQVEDQGRKEARGAQRLQPAHSRDRLRAGLQAEGSGVSGRPGAVSSCRSCSFVILLLHE